MANTALKKITARAKQIRRKSPGIQWKTAIKKASSEYRGGSMGASKPKKKKYRQTGTSNRMRDSMIKAKAPGKRKGYTERRKNRSDVPGTLTGIKKASSNDLKRELWIRTLQDIGKKVVQKDHASTKSQKRSLGKELVELRKKGKLLSPYKK